MDMTTIIILLAIYGAFRAGRWHEHHEIERRRAEAAAVEFADSYDRASRNHS